MKEVNPVVKGGQTKFVIGGVLIIAAIILLIVTNTKAGAQYFLTVDELLDRQEEMVNRDVRVSGAVVGDSIEYDTTNLILNFSVWPMYLVKIKKLRKRRISCGITSSC